MTKEDIVASHLEMILYEGRDKISTESISRGRGERAKKQHLNKPSRTVTEQANKHFPLGKKAMQQGKDTR